MSNEIFSKKVPTFSDQHTYEALCHIRDNKLFLLETGGSAGIENWPVSGCNGDINSIGNYNSIISYLEKTFPPCLDSKIKTINVPVAKCMYDINDKLKEEGSNNKSYRISSNDNTNSTLFENTNDEHMFDECGKTNDLSTFLKYLCAKDKDENRTNETNLSCNKCCWYLKDWHMVTDINKSITYKNTSPRPRPPPQLPYIVPKCFQDDWLNNWCDHCGQEDYRFL